MVEYNEFVSIVFEVAEEQGFETSFERNASALTVAAEVWSDRKQELRSASYSTAKGIAQDEVNVT